MKSFLFYWYARYITWREYRYHRQAASHQRKLLTTILQKNQWTTYGVEFGFRNIHSYIDYERQVPAIQYEEIRNYVEQIQNGKKNILTTDPIAYFLTTSGTTSGSKYIPCTKKGMDDHISGAKKLLCFYANDKGHADFLDGKMLFLQGSPLLEKDTAIPSGRLSGLVFHHVPAFFLRNRLPSFEVNVIDDWQEKIMAISKELSSEDMTVIGGIPPWCLQFFELTCERLGIENLRAYFSKFQLYIYGGVDYTSYASDIRSLLGEGVDQMQTFPASEGFYAAQDRVDRQDMLLLLNQGIVYEFIPQHGDDRIPCILDQVILDTPYELMITNSSGLYRYRMGDLIRFTSINPYRIQVIGRTSQFISAFGEHVIGAEIEYAMSQAIKKYGLKIKDYHVCPNISEKRYEWYLEFQSEPESSLSDIERCYDLAMSSKNSYYSDLLHGQIINACKIIVLLKGTFENTRSSLGKQGGQNKVIRLQNNAEYAKLLISKSNKLL